MSLEIARRIISIRKSRNLTQSEFAQHLNTTRPKIAAYELDRVNFDNAFLDYICKTFGVNNTWLTAGQGDMYTETAQSFLEKLAGEFNLSFTAQKIIECYLELDENQQTVIDGFLRSFGKACSADSKMADVKLDETINLYRTTSIASGGSKGVNAPFPITPQAPAMPFTETDAEIEAEVESYRKELQDEKTAKAQSEALQNLKNA